MLLPLAILFFAGDVAAQTVRDPHEAHRLHSDPARYIAALEDPARDARQKPEEVVKALRLKKGELIADLGAGSGYFTLRLAREVGPEGHVYAVDISPEMILHLNERIRDAGLLNVSTILAPPDDPLLPQKVDRFFIVDVWHHIDDQPAYLSLMKKLLKPGGQVVMIDFHKRDLPFGPPTAMKIAREDLIAQMEEHGFEVAGEHAFLPYQYFVVFGEKTRLSQRCTNRRHRFSVSYPEGWHTNSGEVIPACSAFDPQPVEVPRESEIPFDIAILLDVQNVSFDTTAAPSRWERILSAERLAIGGREAFRVEAEATGEGLADRGMRSFRYAIEIGEGKTLIATKHDTGTSYERHKKVLTRMVETVQFD